MWLSASHWVAACNGITIMSSLNRNGLSTKNPLHLCGDRIAQPLRAVPRQRLGVPAVDGHDVNRVVLELECALQAGRAEVHPEREHLALSGQGGGLGDLLGRDEVGVPSSSASPSGPSCGRRRRPCGTAPSCRAMSQLP